jgi:hypothetical protein
MKDTTTRNPDLRQMLCALRREVQDELQSHIRHGRAGQPNDGRDALERTDVDTQGNIRFALREMRAADSYRRGQCPPRRGRVRHLFRMRGRDCSPTAEGGAVRGAVSSVRAATRAGWTRASARSATRRSLALRVGGRLLNAAALSILGEDLIRRTYEIRSRVAVGCAGLFDRVVVCPESIGLWLGRRMLRSRHLKALNTGAAGR